MAWTLKELFAAYRGRNPGFRANWPGKGLAVTGDFAGIQKYVLKPVPGAQGAAKRLRGRSLQVVAVTQLAAEETARRVGGRVFYQAGGRFLVVAERPVADWREKLDGLRGEMDAFFLAEFRGETVFHLAEAEFGDGKLPHALLSERLAAAKRRPLARVLLRNGEGWEERAFWKEPDAVSAFRCPACLATADVKVVQKDEDQEEICAACDRDKRLGATLAGLRTPSLEKDPAGGIRFLGERYKLADRGIGLDLVHHLPRDGRGDVADFEQIAEWAKGQRKYLGYLRLDADHVGKAFRETEGDAGKTLALSLFLQGFFCGAVQRMISEKFPAIYPVYGGGDDLFVIGPWDQTLDFVKQLREDLRKLVEEGGKEAITFSAAMVLAKPGQHILTKADEAEEALGSRAKAVRASIHALGETVDWGAFPRVLQKAGDVAGWRQTGSLSAGFLRDVMRLNERWRRNQEDVKYRPLLHYQIERNVDKRNGAAVNWARGLLRENELDWKRAGFFVRYAMLAAAEKNKGGKDE